MIKKILLEEWENLSGLIRVINKNGGQGRERNSNIFAKEKFRFSLTLLSSWEYFHFPCIRHFVEWDREILSANFNVYSFLFF